MEALSVFILSLMPRMENAHQLQTLFWVGVCLILVAKKSLSRVHWSLVLLMSWVVGSALYCSMFVKSPYIVYGDFVALAFAFNAAKAAVVLLVVIAALLSLKNLNSLLLGFTLLACVDAMRIFFGDGFRHNHGLMSYSIWDNQSMGASMLAAMLPMVSATFKKWWLPYLLFVPAIIWAHSSVAWAALFVGLAAPFIARREIEKVMVLVLVASAGGIFILHDKLLNDDGRRSIWSQIWSFWDKAPTAGEQINHFLGAGTGSFMMYGPHINMINGNDKLFFIWVHSDWFQILFEQGYIGLALAFLTAGFALWRSRQLTWLFSSILTYAFVMIAQMPWRYLPSSIFGAALLMKALSAKEETCLQG